MMEEKKEFNKAEVEVIRFEKTDVIATSCTENGPSGTFDDPMEEVEGD